MKKWGRTGEEIVRVVDREFPQLREIGGDEGSARETNRRRESEKERRSFAEGGGASTAGEDGSASEDERIDVSTDLSIVIREKRPTESS